MVVVLHACESVCERECVLGRVQVVTKRILQRDIFNTTKFRSISSTHGGNLNSKLQEFVCQCVCVCVCVCVRVSSH